MTKQIKIFVKGSMAIGKTTFINAVRDLLKKNKKFKESFDGYEFDIYEFVEDENKEQQEAVCKKWTITEGKFDEKKEFISVVYEKSFFSSLWTTITKLFKWIFKLFIK